jgi:hypothetical protein
MKVGNVRGLGVAVVCVDAKEVRVCASPLRVGHVADLLTVDTAPLTDLTAELAVITCEVDEIGFDEALTLNELAFRRIIQHQEPNIVISTQFRLVLWFGFDSSAKRVRAT